MKVIGSSIYAVCDTCGDIVKLNKFIIGSLHICALPEDDQEEIKRQRIMNNNLLEISS